VDPDSFLSLFTLYLLKIKTNGNCMENDNMYNGDIITSSSLLSQSNSLSVRMGVLFLLYLLFDNQSVNFKENSLSSSSFSYNISTDKISTDKFSSSLITFIPFIILPLLSCVSDVNLGFILFYFIYLFIYLFIFSYF
jgi:hypothetical protein